MLRLLIKGEPATITAQQKGISWKSRVIYTKSAVKAEARRMRRELHVWNGKEFVRPAEKFQPLTGPLHVSVKFVFAMTEEQMRRHAEQLTDPKFEIHHGKRPDVDNSLKLLLDTFTALGIWGDDGQIDDLNLHKRRGTVPRIDIAIRQIEPQG